MEGCTQQEYDGGRE